MHVGYACNQRIGFYMKTKIISRYKIKDMNTKTYKHDFIYDKSLRLTRVSKLRDLRMLAEEFLLTNFECLHR
jgi:hypothetical protein